MAFQDFDLISERRKAERRKKQQRKIAIAVVLTLLLILALSAAVVYFVVMKYDHHDRAKSSSTSSKHKSSSSSDNGNGEDKSVKTLCVGTDYSKTCEDTLSNTVKNSKELLTATMEAAVDEIDKGIKQAPNVIKLDTPQKKAAFDDCMLLLNDANEDLNASISNIKDLEKLSPHAPDLNNWLSAVITYQDTCVNGFPDGEEKMVMHKSLITAGELSSNALAIVSQLASTLKSSDFEVKRHVLADAMPAWMNGEDRRMLKADTPKQTPNATVAKDGTGNFTTINAALAAIPQTYQGRYVIFVKAGIYEESVVITKKMVNLTIYGGGSQKSIVTGSKNYVDGVSTYQSATFAVMGEGFMAQSIGFRNTAGPEKHQAVALRVQADKSIFLNCRMEAYQGTLYVHTYRQFYRGCYITGTVDFIFGNAAAIFQNCMIYVRRPMDNQQNIVTAQGRTDKHQTTGIVLQNCCILANDKLSPDQAKIKSYLGRPWKEYSKTIIMETEIGDLIDPEGWMPWSGDFALKTLYYAEYKNTGPGSALTYRVKWPGYKGAIKKDEAMKYTVVPFIQGDTWIKALQCPVRLDLSS